MPVRIRLVEPWAEVVRRTLRLDGERMTLSEEAAAGIFPTSGLFSYEPDEHVIEQDEESQDAYVVCDGTVAITKTFGTAATTLATLRTGDVFGEMALVRGGARVASAVAQGPCRVYRLTAADARAAMASRPALAALFSGLTLLRGG